MAVTSLLDRLNEDGYVLIPKVLTDEQLEKLRNASKEAIELAHAGKWDDVRTLPKQFPPWNVKENPVTEGIWGVQSVMHPDMPNHDEFIKFYFSDAIVQPTKELLQCSDDDLVMELFNLLIRPDRDFELRWHRDDIPATATSEQELERLNKAAFSAQWNLALYDDASLIVVPKSHRRARTETERAADPYEKTLPDMLAVKMQPGDVVFYNNNILHRGVYDSSIERMTLHGSVGHRDGAQIRARNVLQHGMRNWLDRLNLDTLKGGEKKRAEHMRENLVKIGKDVGDVGYSLTG